MDTDTDSDSEDGIPVLDSVEVLKADIGPDSPLGRAVDRVRRQVTETDSDSEPYAVHGNTLDGNTLDSQ